MASYNLPPDVALAFAALTQRIEVLERNAPIPRFTAAKRPAAATMPTVIIYNTTTAKHEGSNGVTWSPLY